MINSFSVENPLNQLDFKMTFDKIFLFLIHFQYFFNTNYDLIKWCSIKLNLMNIAQFKLNFCFFIILFSIIYFHQFLELIKRHLLYILLLSYTM